jgi:hypothetical protein
MLSVYLAQSEQMSAPKGDAVVKTGQREGYRWNGGNKQPEFQVLFDAITVLKEEVIVCGTYGRSPPTTLLICKWKFLNSAHQSPFMLSLYQGAKFTPNSLKNGIGGLSLKLHENIFTTKIDFQLMHIEARIAFGGGNRSTWQTLAALKHRTSIVQQCQCHLACAGQGRGTPSLQKFQPLY